MGYVGATVPETRSVTVEWFAHVMVSLVLGLIAGLVAAGFFDQETGAAVAVGVVVFLAYWGIIVFVEGDVL